MPRRELSAIAAATSDDSTRHESLLLCAAVATVVGVDDLACRAANIH
jgi:hypothetical protein